MPVGARTNEGGDLLPRLHQFGAMITEDGPKHPGGRPRVTVEPEQVRRLRNRPGSWRWVAGQLGIGTATAMRLYKASQNAGDPSQNSPREVGR